MTGKRCWSENFMAKKTVSKKKITDKRRRCEIFLDLKKKSQKIDRQIALQETNLIERMKTVRSVGSRNYLFFLSSFPLIFSFS